MHQNMRSKRSPLTKKVFLQKQTPEMFYTKAVLKNFAIFTGKHLRWSLFLIKLLSQDLRPATSSKRDYNTGIFL